MGRRETEAPNKEWHETLRPGYDFRNSPGGPQAHPPNEAGFKVRMGAGLQLGRVPGSRVRTRVETPVRTERTIALAGAVLKATEGQCPGAPKTARQALPAGERLTYEGNLVTGLHRSREGGGVFTGVPRRTGDNEELPGLTHGGADAWGAVGKATRAVRGGDQDPTCNSMNDVLARAVEHRER